MMEACGPDILLLIILYNRAVMICFSKMHSEEFDASYDKRYP